MLFKNAPVQNEFNILNLIFRACLYFIFDTYIVEIDPKSKMCDFYRLMKPLV